MDALSKLLSDLSGKSEPIDVMIDNQLKTRLQENRES
jgi:hypothetical protein